MKILMAHPHDIYSDLEPWTVRITYLAQEFVRRGHEVRLVYHLHDPSTPLEAASLRQDFPFETIPQIRFNTTLVRRMSWYVDLARWADVIHFQKCFDYVSLPSVAASYRLGKPVHYDWDDWEYEIFNYRPNDPRVGTHIDRLERALPRMVDTVSVASRALHDMAVGLGVDEHRLFEAHVGADLERFHPAVDGSQVLTDHDLEGPIVLYLGQLHGAQYCELFLGAARRVLDSGRPATFVVVGSGDRFGELHALAEQLGLTEHIVFTGAIHHSRVPQYIAAADVAVACFEDNAQTRTKSPLKIVEYLASGKAIVTSAMGEATRMVHDCGLAVPPGDEQALAQGICTLLDDPGLRRRLGAAARRRAELKYNWGTTADNLLRAYRTGLELRGRRFRPASLLRERGRALALKPWVQDNLDLVGILDGEYAYTGPRLVQLDLTNDCNNDCIGCWCNSPLLGDRVMPADVKRQHIPYDKVVELLDELHRMGTREIYLAGGGEPFMHPQIMDVLRAIKQRGMVCFINTNFTLVDEQRAEELVELGIDHLTVSVWAGTPEVYSRTHPNKTEDSFHRLRQVLQHLTDRKSGPPYIKIYNVISRLNYNDVEAMVDFACQTGVDSVEFTVLDVIPGATDRLLISEPQRQELYDRCLALQERLAQPTSCQPAPQLFHFDQFLRRISGDETTTGEYDRGIIDQLPCTIGWTFARILPDGKVNSCLKAHRIPIGDIYNARFEELWNCSAQIHFRRMTNRLRKDDPFFSSIGNDPDARCGCHRGCDDLARNQTTSARLQSLGAGERAMLHAAHRFLRWRGVLA